MTRFCGAGSEWGSTCILPDEPEHLDHLDEDDRTWLNPSIVRTHDRRRSGNIMTRAREIAARTEPERTSKFRR
jgi:hypothetical protein